MGITQDVGAGWKASWRQARGDFFAWIAYAVMLPLIVPMIGTAVVELSGTRDASLFAALGGALQPFFVSGAVLLLAVTNVWAAFAAGKASLARYRRYANHRMGDANIQGRRDMTEGADYLTEGAVWGIAAVACIVYGAVVSAPSKDPVVYRWHLGIWLASIAIGFFRLLAACREVG